MTFTKTYYLVKVVGEDKYYPRQQRIWKSRTEPLESIMSGEMGDISKAWYIQQAHAKGAITGINNSLSNYDKPKINLEIVPVTVRLEIND